MNCEKYSPATVAEAQVVIEIRRMRISKEKSTGKGRYRRFEEMHLQTILKLPPSLHRLECTDLLQSAHEK